MPAPLTAPGWPLSLLEKLGLSDLAAKWPQRILPLGAPVGHLTAEAAAHTGLPEGLLVAQVSTRGREPSA